MTGSRVSLCCASGVRHRGNPLGDPRACQDERSGFPKGREVDRQDFAPDARNRAGAASKQALACALSRKFRSLACGTPTADGRARVASDARSPGRGRANGSSGSKLPMCSRISVASPTEVAKTDTQSSVRDRTVPARRRGRAVGFSPTTPLNAAGMRPEPPESVPSAEADETCRHRDRRASSSTARHVASWRPSEPAERRAVPADQSPAGPCWSCPPVAPSSSRRCTTLADRFGDVAVGRPAGRRRQAGHVDVVLHRKRNAEERQVRPVGLPCGDGAQRLVRSLRGNADAASTGLWLPYASILACSAARTSCPDAVSRPISVAQHAEMEALGEVGHWRWRLLPITWAGPGARQLRSDRSGRRGWPARP